MTKDEYESLGKRIIDCAIEVHRQLGPGLLESVFEICLVSELRSRGIHVENQVQLPLFYKGVKLNKNIYY